ncbi:MAG: hypothetical protein SV375_06985 [Thermodesulfobacteriota bacterium]|nr:hypothetical protein [Thermodesulfobacteriota bacterium]
MISANRSFYRMFQAVSEDTEGRFLYDPGNKEWNIPKLRDLLEEIIPKNQIIEDFEVRHNFPRVGEKIMLLNARKISWKQGGEELIIPAIEDMTQRIDYCPVLYVMRL